MGIESFDYNDFAFYGCGTYVEVTSIGFLFKAPFEEYILDYKEIKLPASAERTFKIRCLAEHIVQDDSEQLTFFQICCYSSRTTEINKTLDDLMKSELFSDVTIVSSDGKHFNVHKNIIACKNEVFRAYLVHDMEENKTGTISSPFDAEVLEELLRYIYLEHANNLDSLSARLLIAADYYRVEDLKGMCELDLCKRLTVDNALEMYKLADLHSASHLKTYCEWFIAINLRKISESAAWTEFKPSALMKDLLHSFLVM